MSHEEESCCCGGQAPEPAAHTCSCAACQEEERAEEEKNYDKLKVIVAAIFFVVACVLQSVNPGGFMDVFPVALIVFAIPYLIVGLETIVEAIEGILGGELLDENFLMCIASMAAMAMGEYPEAVAVMLFFHVGELFEEYAVNKSRGSIAAMMDIAAEVAHVEREAVADVDPAEVAVGEVIVVRPGERVPLDGVVLEGAGQVDTSALTGEAVPVEVAPGSELLSGCVNGSAMLRVRVTAPFADSTVSRILDMVENARSRKAKIENFITRFARVYTPIVVGCAAALAVLPPLVLGMTDVAVWSDWIYRACVFLVVSCPCALVISVPLAFFAGIGSLSSQGVLVKGGNYLEALARLDTVAFDKTGTLTEGRFEVVDVLPAGRVSAEELLELAAIAEQNSTHPIALSILRAYGKVVPVPADSVEDISGFGLAVGCARGRLLVGTSALMEHEGIAGIKTAGQGTVCHVALEGEYLGCLTLADVVKPEAAAAVAALKQLGVRETIMLTGDKAEVAAEVAAEVGVDRFFAELLPGDKLTHVEQLLAAQNENQTLAVVGDGINDAPVLTRSDVGIAMGALGADAAIEAADVVLMDDNPARIASAIQISRRTVGIARQNIVFALGIKIGVLILGALGIANMWLAVFADVGVSVICILNSMRVLRSR